MADLTFPTFRCCLLILSMIFTLDDHNVACCKLGRHIQTSWICIRLNKTRYQYIPAQIDSDKLNWKGIFSRFLNSSWVKIVHVINQFNIHSHFLSICFHLIRKYMNGNCESNCWFTGSHRFLSVCASYYQFETVCDSLWQPARHKQFATVTLPTLIISHSWNRWQ